MVRIIKNLRGIFPSQQPEKKSIFWGGGGGRNKKSIKKVAYQRAHAKTIEHFTRVYSTVHILQLFSETVNSIACNFVYIL